MFLFFYFLLHIFLFGQEIKFQLFESDAILGTGTVYCVMQDRTGFIWLGTEYGLYRYDGHDLKIFRNDPDNANSLSDNTVWSLYEDNRGFIWVGTANGGINRLDPVTEKFISWQSTKSFSATGPGLSDNGITAIIQDKNGYIWIGTYKGGLNRFDTKTNRFFHWYKDSLSANTLPVNYVTSLLVDQENQLWIGSYEGLYSMEAEGSSTDFKYWNVFQQKNSELSSQIVWNLFESPYDTGTGFWVGTFSGLKFFNKKKGIIRNYQAEPIKNNLFSNSYGSISEEVINGERVMWIGTYGGLLQFNLSTGKFVRYQYQEDKIGSISNDRVIDIMIDRSGVLWIATSGGLNYITSRYNNFKNWTYRKSGKNISLKDVTSVCSFKDGSIWIGATSGLYTISNPELSTQVTKYTGFNETEIWTLTPGNNQNLWIGTYGNGLFLLNLKTGKITHWTSNSEIPGSLGNDYIKSLCFDSSGYLWIGLWGKGLNRFHPTSGEWRYYLSDRDNPNSLSYNDVWSLYEDKFGNLWVGTKGGGLNLYDRNTRKFKRWLNNSSKIQWLSHNGILTITEAQPFSNNISDSLAALWIGTENGITYFLYNPYSPDSATTKINTFSVKNGLPGNIIRGISEVNNKLWLGLNTGLVSMDNELVMNSEDNPEKIRRLQQLKLNHYTVKNGLPENDFASGAVILSKSGKLFWGNSGGLISFNPNEIKENLLIAPTVITEILINNRKIQRGTFNFPDSSFQLRYNENTVSFRFSALDYKAPKDCRYAYRLVGLDKEWIDVGKQRIANYSNLSPGNYTFEVKSTNSDEIWNQNPAKISFSISPPWWLSLWAYSLYVLIVFGIFFFLRKYELNRIRLKHQLELQMFETRKLKELEKIKSRFFTNLSHEFRTPLMLISGPVEQLRDKIFTGNENEMYDLIIRNTSRLSELIEQLLALSQLEAGSLPLHASKKNLVPILKGLVFSFESFAHNKGINLFFSASEDTIIAWIDQDKFEKIINNLLSNALKFTPKGGKVEVKIEFPSALVPGNNTIIIKILDTGIGISSDLHEKVFDRFFQVDDSAKRLYSGSGIGLALVKELTDLHHWRISLESQMKEVNLRYLFQKVMNIFWKMKL